MLKLNVARIQEAMPDGEIVAVRQHDDEHVSFIIRAGSFNQESVRFMQNALNIKAGRGRKVVMFSRDAEFAESRIPVPIPVKKSLPEWMREEV